MKRSLVLLGVSLTLPIVILLAVATLLVTAWWAPRPGRPAPAPASLPTERNRGGPGLVFAPNVGQAAAAVRFQARVPGGTAAFTRSGLILAPAAGGLPAVRLEFLGANPATRLAGDTPLAGRISYLRGADPTGWRTSLPTFGSLVYHDLYPGVALRYAGGHGTLEGIYELAPGAAPGPIRWRYPDATRIRLDGEGNLRITLAGGKEVADPVPTAWQVRDGRKAPVGVRFALAADGSAGFAVDAYDPAQPLTIDPSLSYSSYLGGGAEDAGTGIALDAAGNIYVAGTTNSYDFPLADPYQPANHGGQHDVFITKFDPSGTTLIYSTYLGGSGDDLARGIAVDAAGDVLVTGRTDSLDFPLAHPIQPRYAGGGDAFVTKLNAAGSGLIYSTYLGGGGSEDDEFNVVNLGTIHGGSIAVDTTGNAYLTGSTGSPDFPLAHPYQRTPAGGFVAKLNALGTALVYSTYLGGQGLTLGAGIAVDVAGAAYLTGFTYSPDFPLRNPFQSLCPSDCVDGAAFVTKLNPAGSALTYSTYLGGAAGAGGFAIAVDDAGAAYVTGATLSNDFPIVHSVQPPGEGLNAFITKLTPTGSGLTYSSYLAGSQSSHVAWNFGHGIALDPAGNAYVTGETNASDFPLVDAIQGFYGGDPADAFVTKMDTGGTALLYSTYLGGADADVDRAIAVDAGGNAYVTGDTNSPDFPLIAPYQVTSSGGDAFLAKINPLPGTPLPTPSPLTPASTPTATPTATPLPPPPCPGTPFADVCPGDWYAPPVTDLAAQRAVSGYDCGGPGEPCYLGSPPYFRPYAAITRGQLSKVTLLAFAIPMAATAQIFADVPPENPFYMYVNTAFTLNIVGGYACGGPGEPCDAQQRPYFRAFNSITRGQVTKIVVLAGGRTLLMPSVPTFSDVPAGQPFFRFIETAYAAGMISGYTCGRAGEPCDAQQRPYFEPAYNITRAQAAKIVDLGRPANPPTASPTPAGAPKHGLLAPRAP